MHAQLLFAYLPTEQFTATMLSKDQVRRAKHQAFHHAMKRIFKSLKVAGRDGVEMASGDGKVRRCHLIVAVYVADYPEQCLVTCTRYMHCPICHVEPNDLGKYGESRRRRQRETVQKLDQARDASTRVGANLILKEAGNTDTLEPFFTGLPFTDINQSITPDILHQLYQGVIKHMTQWLTRLVGPNELDLRLSRLPPNHALRTFKSGISGFSRLSGNEHRQIAKQLLGCIVDFAPSEAIRASRALLDFLYIAQAEAQTDKSLEKLEDALEEFHKHKNIFLETKAREADAFDFPKLHGLLHYAPKIRDFGTTDNYNTENTERLHIDMAKDAYRATNRKEILPQMIFWLERKEKLFAFSTYIEWRQGASVTAPCIQKKLEADTYFGYHRITLAKTPSLANMPLTNFVQIYSLELSSFERALASFVRMRQEYLRVPLHPIPSALVISTWFRFKTSNRQPAYLSSKADNFEESIHVSPCRKSQHGRAAAPARFDTVLVNETWDGHENGLQGYRVARIRAVFTLPEEVVNAAFGTSTEVQHLAYVEWYTKFIPPSKIHGMYSVHPSFRTQGIPESSVIELGQVRQSVHLFPRFPRGSVKETLARDWTSENCLDKCSDFLVNRHLSRYAFRVLSGT